MCYKRYDLKPTTRLQELRIAPDWQWPIDVGRFGYNSGRGRNFRFITPPPDVSGSRGCDEKGASVSRPADQVRGRARADEATWEPGVLA